MQTFGEKLRQEREKRGWSLSDLSKRSGVAMQSISRYESGRAFPNLMSALGLADALEMSLDELTGRKQP